MPDVVQSIPAAATTRHSGWKPPPGPYSVYVATPADDGHKLDFWRSMLQLQAACLSGWTKHHFRFRPTPGDSLIPRARNTLLWDWYTRTADDFLLFIDTDLDFRPVDVFTLFDEPPGIIAGMYAIKEQNLRWCINGIPGHEKDPETQRQHVATAGTGMFAVHRHVVGSMIEAAESWPHWRVKFYEDGSGNEQWNLFYNGVVEDKEWFPTSRGGLRYLSEDWGFCYMARRLGFPVTIDHRCIALHEGAIKYPLQARRLTREEEEAGVINQPDGSQTPL